MKALSVKQPLASLLIAGIKLIEVRSWPTDHRGELLVCATASPNNMFVRLPEDPNQPLQLHAGCMLGIVDLKDCRPMTKADEDAACCPLSHGAWAWDVEPVCWVRPDRLPGRLQLFEVSDRLIHRLPGAIEDVNMWDYPIPQGAKKWTKSSPTLDLSEME